ncbi:hypothetical protein [Methanosarcina sp. DH1]|uniref:hypothetical protein n=1 Tax=Methanosarcina sp. DH1 TaxID=2605695 RepID=UPI001E2983B9|nr:hypothetical protein [Methanosarcina sp. DH1]
MKMPEKSNRGMPLKGIMPEKKSNKEKPLKGIIYDKKTLKWSDQAKDSGAKSSVP